VSTATPAADFFSAHRSRLDEAVEATRTRGYDSAFPDSPSRAGGRRDPVDMIAQHWRLGPQRFAYVSLSSVTSMWFVSAHATICVLHGCPQQRLRSLPSRVI
jgi:hypothetical protein